MLLIFSLLFQTHALAQYTDPLFETALEFGFHSQWIQPWRGYLETVPSTWFLKGVGVALSFPPTSRRADYVASRYLEVMEAAIAEVH
jgi:hypothetical protein